MYSSSQANSSMLMSDKRVYTKIFVVVVAKLSAKSIDL
ncbi:MAG: hypothetical protein ACFC1C_01625 [Candidatus Malihini olakiniferum]